MQLIKQLSLLLAATCLAVSPLHAAEQPQGESQADAKGPHGGILLQQENTTVELQIFERDVPPEYRAWVTDNGKPVIDDIELSVNLTRLGGQVDTFNFDYQSDYWLGDGVVNEPHSFDVEVTLAMEGKK